MLREILKLGLSLLFGESSKRKIRSGPECGQGVPAIGKPQKACFGLITDLQQQTMFLYTMLT
jgi:hypothetical protein